ncbi:MAG: anthranilate synthase component I family protein [Phycisphaerae bacterium]|nr:anthranilate synthase component I family protein [Phycisphaerae bacterium]
MTVGTVARTDKYIPCKLHYKEIRASIDLLAVSQVFAGLESASILGGNTAKTDADRFSYWAAKPRDVFEFRSGQEEPFAKLQKVLNKYRLAEDIDVDSRLRGNDTGGDILPKGMFRGGWVGYFSYELGRYIEPAIGGPAMVTDDLKMPLMRLCFYDRFIAYDHGEAAFWLIALELPGDSAEPDEKLSGLEELLTRAGGINVPALAPADLDDIDLAQFRRNMDKDYYLRMVEKIKRYIYDGDVYQINFSQRFECDYAAEAIDLFHWQNRYNPSGYSAYIDGPDFKIVSASPEMFMTISDRFISTKPIKGTRRRLGPTDENRPDIKQVNEDNLRALLDSEKERAELNMIVDLERNDLAKVCEPGTRRVIQHRTIAAYPTVFHAVATVAGRLRSEVTFCDCLRAMFPGGSITGAPKIRSMEIIDETEPTARGVYTGSIGYIGLDGNVCLNIAIRTIIIAGQKAYAQTGGGIVADSSPQAEWNETITKARALLAGINSVQRTADSV